MFTVLSTPTSSRGTKLAPSFPQPLHMRGSGRPASASKPRTECTIHALLYSHSP